MINCWAEILIFVRQYTTQCSVPSGVIINLKLLKYKVLRYCLELLLNSFSNKLRIHFLRSQTSTYVICKQDILLRITKKKKNLLMPGR